MIFLANLKHWLRNDVKLFFRQLHTLLTSTICGMLYLWNLIELLPEELLDIQQRNLFQKQAIEILKSFGIAAFRRDSFFYCYKMRKQTFIDHFVIW